MLNGCSLSNEIATQPNAAHRWMHTDFVDGYESDWICFEIFNLLIACLAIFGGTAAAQKRPRKLWTAVLNASRFTRE